MAGQKFTSQPTLSSGAKQLCCCTAHICSLLTLCLSCSRASHRSRCRARPFQPAPKSWESKEDPGDGAEIEMDDNPRPEPGSCEAQGSGQEHSGGSSSSPHLLSVHLTLPSTGNHQGWSDCGFVSYSITTQLCQVSLGGGFHVLWLLTRAQRREFPGVTSPCPHGRHLVAAAAFPHELFPADGSGLCSGSRGHPVFARNTSAPPATPCSVPTCHSLLGTPGQGWVGWKSWISRTGLWGSANIMKLAENRTCIDFFAACTSCQTLFSFFLFFCFISVLAPQLAVL